MGKFENLIIDEIEKIVDEKAIRQKTFEWLPNKHTFIKEDNNYIFLESIFKDLKGDSLGLEKKRKSYLKVDAYFEKNNIVVEIDEIQHFTIYRQITLNKLKKHEFVKLSYDIDTYIDLCQKNFEKALSKGQKGYRSPKHEFPVEYGRAMQRAYFDSMKDVLIPSYLSNPVIRFTEFELNQQDPEMLRRVLNEKISKFLIEKKSIV